MLAIYLAALDSADNAEAFEAVYERYKRLVYHVACQIVHDPHLAEDVAQEVFLYIAKNFARLHRQDPHKFAAYLVSCTRSRAFLLLAQRPDAPGEEEPDFDRNADPAPVPEDAVIDEQQAPDAGRAAACTHLPRPTATAGARVHLPRNCRRTCPAGIHCPPAHCPRAQTAVEGAPR